MDIGWQARLDDESIAIYRADIARNIAQFFADMILADCRTSLVLGVDRALICLIWPSVIINNVTRADFRRVDFSPPAFMEEAVRPV